MRVRVSGVDMNEAVELVGEWLGQDRQKVWVVFTPNVEMVMLADGDPIFLKVLNQGDLNVADSVGLVWADTLLARKQKRDPLLAERVTGIDLAEKVCSEAAKRGKRVFLVGGGVEVAEKAAKSLSKRYVGLQIWGITGSQEVLRESEAEWQEMRRVIEKLKPDLALVAFGAPAQELWVMKHKDELGALGVKVVMVVGGAIDVWAGKVQRAPVKWQKNGWEWLWRLVHQPWRWRRQLSLVRFVGRVMASD